ncbi:MAG: hypothetical protein WEC84_03700 [Candidatus Andersenbacteria bacterium]
MTVLLIDTSGERAQVAILEDVNVVAHYVWENTPYVGPQILEHIEAAFQEAGISWDRIDRIAAHRGPRKDKLFFSGLRTGIATAMLLASAKQKELVELTGDSLEEMVATAGIAATQYIISPRYE